MVLVACALEIWGVFRGALCGVLGAEANNCLSFIVAKTKEWLDHRIQGPGQVVGTLPDESLAGQEQIKDYLKQLAEFLDDDEARYLGIYGMGGVGKTTLLRKFNNELVGSHAAGRRFDYVFFITVSQVVDIDKIKKDIEDQLRGNLSSLSKSRFLLMLDDVWQEVDLMSMGIPIPSSANRCKVIMTGRSKSYCRIEHVDVKYGRRSFQVSTLNESEAWIFFQRKVGSDFDSEDEEIVSLAKSVARRCGGLPLALEIVGSSMIDANVSTWRVAEINLSKSPHTQEGMKDKVLHLLKFSFDRLKDDNIQNCLLYCCLWKEDGVIQKHDLIDYWFGEGFLDCDHSESLHEARDRGHKNIAKLVSCSLLQEAPKTDYVRMHDVVREMCLWLTSGEFDEYGKFYAYHQGQYNYSSSTRALKNLRRLSAEPYGSWNEKKNFPNDFIAGPALHTLLCGFGIILDGGFLIEEGFFQDCTSLCVLKLKNCRLNFTLEDLCLLKQLRYLDLSFTKLIKLPDGIDSLTNLVYLNLSWNRQLMVLPNSIGNLVKLQKLDLSYTGLEELPVTIGSLTKLEILCLLKAGQFKTCPDALGSLENLRFLDFCGTKIHHLPDSIKNLKKLRFLNVSGTRLKTMSKALASFTDLEYLNYSHTRVRRIPDYIVRLRKLKVLCLCGISPLSLQLPSKLQYHILSHSGLGCIYNNQSCRLQILWDYDI